MENSMNESGAGPQRLRCKETAEQGQGLLDIGLTRPLSLQSSVQSAKSNGLLDGVFFSIRPPEQIGAPLFTGRVAI